MPCRALECAVPKIHRLSDQLANQIAAGEVIERPGSAAKELVENALDAGATRIDVVIAEGGRSLRVTDDGEGMGPDDALLAFDRFATSKVSQIDDLFSLRTMGFRGEALASIAAVARVELRTRRRSDDAGTLVRIEGGEIVASRPCGTAEGTTLAVQDLFFNTPARLKFMKAPATEAAHVVEAVTALALAHPEVAMRATSGNRVVLDTTGARDLAEAAALVLGAEIGPALLRCQADGEAGHVHGLIAPPELIRGDRAKQWLFVNGRPVRNPALARAVDEAFSGHIPASRHPIYAIAVTIDPEAVDFNVHPTKKEIRLRDGATLYALVRDAVSRGLRQLPPGDSGLARRWPDATRAPDRPGFAEPHLSHLARGVPDPARRGRAIELGSVGAQQALDLYRPALKEATSSYDPGSTAASGASLTASTHAESAADAGGRDFPWDALTVLGQLHDTYLVLEHPDGLLLVDQHNSHERFLYEQLGAERVASQELLIPRIVDLPAASAEALEAQLGPLAELGFALERLGEGCWQLRAAPAVLAAEEAERTLLALLFEAADGGLTPGRQLSDRWRVTLACHSATKAGDRLAPGAISRLIAQWRTCQQPFTCPHGRPTSILIPLGELHRRCMRGMQTR